VKFVNGVGGGGRKALKVLTVEVEVIFSMFLPYIYYNFCLKCRLAFW